MHEQGFRVSRSEDGSLIFLDPDGSLLLSSPRPLRLAGDSIPLLLEKNLAAQIEITDQTGGPTEWTGMPFDLDQAVTIVLPTEESEESEEEDPPIEKERFATRAA